MTTQENVMLEAIDELVDEVRLLWHALVRSGERLHDAEPITLGMRAVLELLASRGPATVPQIARRRGVTRQHIQGFVNALLELKLVSLEPNPEHRRSLLVCPTPAGAQAIERMKKRERRFFAGVAFGVSASEVSRASKTLRSLRNTIGG